jgi:PAP_fibrillin
MVPAAASSSLMVIMMITVITLSASSCQLSNGFQIASTTTRRARTSSSSKIMTALFMSTLDAPSVDTQAVEFKMTARDVLLDVATKCKDEFGLFLVDKKAKKELAEAVENVEATFVPMLDLTSQLLGTWDLISTTSTTTQGIDTSTFLQGPLKQLADMISSTTNRYVTVQQSIKADDKYGNICRVDHVLAYKPPSVLTELFDNLPTPLATLNVNPFDVSNSKIVLVHKATQSTIDPTKIALTLSSVILNVAGNSTYLDPAGKDITSINLPLTEFLGGGEFITTYVDDEVRVSRGKQAGVSVLRVFVKHPPEATILTNIVAENEIPDAEIIAAVDTSSNQNKPSDVEP